MAMLASGGGIQKRQRQRQRLDVQLSLSPSRSTSQTNTRHCRYVSTTAGEDRSPSILHPPSIIHPPSSILHPPSSILPSCILPTRREKGWWQSRVAHPRSPPKASTPGEGGLRVPAHRYSSSSSSTTSVLPPAAATAGFFDSALMDGG